MVSKLEPCVSITTEPVMELRGQLDHVFYDARLEPADVRVLEMGRSDHLPVVADCERRDAPGPG
jgi:endonuclease/exonuclease/phosphatase family metal-dependent hydrolase